MPAIGGRVTDDGWDGYLAAFHSESAGITEDVLAEARATDGDDPYDWLVRALPGTGVVVDVACGSGPLASQVGGGWVGVDRSEGELRRAAAAAPGRVVLADAGAAPVHAGEVDAVVCSMALMLFDNPGRVVAEMVRLLRVGGRLVTLLPATAPLIVRDRVRYARLLAALRLRRVPFRHPEVMHHPLTLLSTSGLTVVRAERRRFAYPFADADHARRWLRSLYLPGVDSRRLDAAQRVVRRWTGTSIGIPLMRLVATR